MSTEAQPDVDAVYARGTFPFLGLELLVQRGVLIPRPETELLAQEALRVLPEGSPMTVIDVCCGSGNIACAIAALRPHSKVYAADLTVPCVELAQKNVQKLGLQGRLEVRQGDLFAPLQDLGLEGQVDLITCNPPYISTGRLEKERAELLSGEPREAFDGGPYGLSIHQRVIKDAVPLLNVGGRLMFEFGLGQERQMTALFGRAKNFSDLHFVSNASGAPRVAVAVRVAPPETQNTESQQKGA